MAFVCHKTPSTPGVFFPLLEVTLLTAIALAEKECVSNHCKAVALLKLRSRIAFAIRIWSLLTSCLALSHSMDRQFAGVDERTIPSDLVFWDAICFLILGRFPRFSRDERPPGRQHLLFSSL